MGISNINSETLEYNERDLTKEFNPEHLKTLLQQRQKSEKSNLPPLSTLTENFKNKKYIYSK